MTINHTQSSGLVGVLLVREGLRLVPLAQVIPMLEVESVRSGSKVLTWGCGAARH